MNQQSDRPEPNRDEPKQVIVVRMKYPDGKGGKRKLRFGKLGAQLAHASEAPIFDRRIEFLDVNGDPIPIRGVVLDAPPAQIAEMAGSSAQPDGAVIHMDSFPGVLALFGLTEQMDIWSRIRFKKVILVADSDEDLVRIHELALERNLPTALIEDHGLTEFGGVKTKTAVSIGPAEPGLIDEITGRDGLVPCRLA